MKVTHIFNARYRDDIFGVKAIIRGNDVACIQIKYQIALIYEHQIKDIMESKLANDAIFRNDFLRGCTVHFEIPQERNKDDNI